METLTLLITSNGPQVGKTTAAKFFSEKLSMPYKSTSDIVAEEVAKNLGTTAEHIREARRMDSEAYRAELIATGKSLCDTGRYPCLLAFTKGFNIIEGARWENDAAAAHNLCNSPNARFEHIHIEGNVIKKDSTQASELAALATIVIENFGTLEQFQESLDTVLSALMSKQ